MSASELYRSMLAGYDDEHGTELVRTAEALVNWHGDVKAIARSFTSIRTPCVTACAR